MSQDLSRNLKNYERKWNPQCALETVSLSRSASLNSLSEGFNSKNSKINFYRSFGNSIAYLKQAWENIIQEPQWGANISAGITVAAVALPLNLALAIAAGLPASVGLIAGAIGGAFAAIFGGSRFQATGPAAALNIMVFALVQQYGAEGAAAAALLVGLIQLVLSMFSAGSLIKFVPEAVLLGFTTGVGLKLLDSQIPKLFGVDWTVYKMIENLNQPTWLHEVTWPAVVCGLMVMFIIISFKTMPRFPAALLGIALTTQLAIFLNWPIHRVGEIPPLNLKFAIPEFSLDDWFGLAQLAIPLGLLAAIESILSAQAIDRMSGDQHHSNLELLGQSFGNFATGFLGGMPVSGVIVRSSVNVQSGAKNRLASLFHSAILLGSALFLGGILSQIPIASLAGLLCIIGFRLIEFSELLHLLKNNRLHCLGFIAATVGTVSGHIILGLSFGLAFGWLGSRERKNQDSELRPRKTEQQEQMPKHLQVSPSSVTDKTSLVYSVLDRGERWIQHLKEQASIPNTAYVHPNASVIGRVVLGRNVHIAAEASVRADEGTPFFVGENTNIQDGVVIHALKKKWISVQNQQWAVYIGKDVSLAHQALVHGPCYIGDHTFVGFKAVVHDSIIGQGCYIGIGAVVVGVEIPDERYIPHGAIIDTKDKVLTLSRVSPTHQHFNEDVVEVNKGLVQAYRELTYSNQSNI